MFSPEASVQSARSSLRNPRRRQRNSDGLQQQSRRKRSKLSDESFHVINDAHVKENGSAMMNGHAGHGSVENSLVLVDMPVREKKAAPKRAPKEDTTQLLVRPSKDPPCFSLYVCLSVANETSSLDQKCKLQRQEAAWLSNSPLAPKQYAISPALAFTLANAHQQPPSMHPPLDPPASRLP